MKWRSVFHDFLQDRRLQLFLHPVDQYRIIALLTTAQTLICLFKSSVPCLLSTNTNTLTNKNFTKEKHYFEKLIFSTMQMFVLCHRVENSEITAKFCQYVSRIQIVDHQIRKKTLHALTNHFHTWMHLAYPRNEKKKICKLFNEYTMLVISVECPIFCLSKGMVSKGISNI